MQEIKPEKSLSVLMQSALSSLRGDSPSETGGTSSVLWCACC